MTSHYYARIKGGIAVEWPILDMKQPQDKLDAWAKANPDCIPVDSIGDIGSAYKNGSFTSPFAPVMPDQPTTLASSGGSLKA